MTNKLFLRLIALVLIPAMMYMIYIAVCWGMADFHYKSAMKELNNWQSGKITLEKDDWDRLRDKFSKAVHLDPNNHEYHEKLGYSIEGYYLNVESKEEKAQVFRLLALEHYKKSVSLRPTWPYAWAQLVTIKYRLGQIDNEFFDALHNVVELGKWEPGLQRLVIEIGLNEWGAFSFQDRVFLLEVISRSIEKQPQRTLELIRNKGFLDSICLLNRDNNVVVDYCQKYKNVKVNQF